MPGISAAVLLALAQSAGPSNVERGAAELNRGEYAAAKRHLEQEPADPRARALLALAQAATGGCETALPELRRPKQDHLLSRLSLLALAECELHAGRFDAAQAALAFLEKDSPNDPDALYLSADLHRRAWNDSMRRLYREAPASYRVNQLSAEVFETQSKYAEAIAEYKKAIAKNPKAIDLHYKLARAILLQSHDAAALEQAKREFEIELGLNPSDAAAEYQVGQILVSQGKKAEAAPHTERALELRADFPEALMAVAKLRVEAKRYAEAIDLLERSVKGQPRNEAAHYNLMLAYRGAGKVGEAQREKAIVEKLQRPPEGEFTDFLKRLGEKPPRE